MSFDAQKSLILTMSSLSVFYFVGHHFILMEHQGFHCQTQVQEDLPLCFLLRVLQVQLVYLGH